MLLLHHFFSNHTVDFGVFY